VREEAMRGLPAAVALLGAADGGEALDAAAAQAVVAALLKQSVEKIDKIRELAGVTLRALVLGADADHPTPLIPPHLVPHRGTSPSPSLPPALEAAHGGGVWAGRRVCPHAQSRVPHPCGVQLGCGWTYPLPTASLGPVAHVTPAR
jgi:hypothetical protein